MQMYASPSFARGAWQRSHSVRISSVIGDLLPIPCMHRLLLRHGILAAAHAAPHDAQGFHSVVPAKVSGSSSAPSTTTSPSRTVPVVRMTLKYEALACAASSRLQRVTSGRELQSAGSAG